MFYSKQFKKLRSNASPSPEFKTKLLVKLTQENTMTNQSWIRTFAPAVFAALIVFFAMGTGAYAYESPAVTEGHPLHFLKNNIERVEGGLARNAEDRARFHNKMMERRINEAGHLGFGGEEVRALLEAAANEMGLSMEELRGEMRDPEVRMEIMDQLAEQGFEYAEACQQHLEQYGQAQAKGFGVGHHMMDTDKPLEREGGLAEVRRGSFDGMSEDVRELRSEVFSDEVLSIEEKREAFHNGMKKLIDNRIVE